jgi:hypothetical protein
LLWTCSTTPFHSYVAFEAIVGKRINCHTRRAVEARGRSACVRLVVFAIRARWNATLFMLHPTAKYGRTATPCLHRASASVAGRVSIPRNRGVSPLSPAFFQLGFEKCNRGLSALLLLVGPAILLSDLNFGCSKSHNCRRCAMLSPLSHMELRFPLEERISLCQRARLQRECTAT